MDGHMMDGQVMDGHVVDGQAMDIPVMDGRHIAVVSSSLIHHLFF